MIRIFDHLTDREHQVLELLAQGHSNQAIAVALSPAISIRSVERHVSSILQKLGTCNRTQTARLYCQFQAGRRHAHGLILTPQ